MCIRICARPNNCECMCTHSDAEMLMPSREHRDLSAFTCNAAGVRILAMILCTSTTKVSAIIIAAAGPHDSLVDAANRRRVFAGVLGLVEVEHLVQIVPVQAGDALVPEASRVPLRRRKILRPAGPPQPFCIHDSTGGAVKERPSQPQVQCVGTYVKRHGAQ